MNFGWGLGVPGEFRHYVSDIESADGVGVDEFAEYAAESESHFLFEGGGFRRVFSWPFLGVDLLYDGGGKGFDDSLGCPEFHLWASSM